MQEEQKTRLSGVVVFLLANAGTKSEARLPYLYQSKSVPLVSIMLKEDNPFENKGLSEYDGAKVEIDGTVATSGTFIVDNIRRLTIEN